MTFKYEGKSNTPATIAFWRGNVEIVEVTKGETFEIKQSDVTPGIKQLFAVMKVVSVTTTRKKKRKR